MERLSDAELAAKTGEFRVRVQERLAKIPDNAEGDPERTRQLQEERDRARKDALEELLPEAFAVVRETARRTLNMRHFDVQLLGERFALRQDRRNATGRQNAGGVTPPPT